jgi:hypothetical protein
MKSLGRVLNRRMLKKNPSKLGARISIQATLGKKLDPICKIT